MVIRAIPPEGDYEAARLTLASRIKKLIERQAGPRLIDEVVTQAIPTESCARKMQVIFYRREELTSRIRKLLTLTYQIKPDGPTEFK